MRVRKKKREEKRARKHLQGLGKVNEQVGGLFPAANNVQAGRAHVLQLAALRAWVRRRERVCDSHSRTCVKLRCAASTNSRCACSDSRCMCPASEQRGASTRLRARTHLQAQRGSQLPNDTSAIIDGHLP